MADPRIRTIKIKTGVVKRLTKEKTVYEKEAEQQRNRVEKLKSEERDEYDIRKQEEVLQEALMMIPDCQRRLKTAYKDLKTLLEAEAELKDIQEFGLAEQVLKEAELQLA